MLFVFFPSPIPGILLLSSFPVSPGPMEETGKGWNVAGGLQPRHCPLEPGIYLFVLVRWKENSGRVQSSWTAPLFYSSLSSLKVMFLDFRTDDGLSMTFLVPISHPSEGMGWYFSLHDCSWRRCCSTPASTRKIKEPTHFLSVQNGLLILLSILRYAPQDLEGKWETVRLMYLGPTK